MASVRDSPPPSFESMGIPLVPRTQTTPLGKIRAAASLDRLEWTFLLVSLLAALATLGLGVTRLVMLSPLAEDRVFVWLLIVTAGFSMIYAVNGVFREQVYELLVYAVTAVVLTLYVLLNYLDPATPSGSIKLARLVVASVVTLPLVLSALVLAARYHQSADLVFRTVGGNMELQTACKRVLTAQSLLKLDAQLALSTVLLVVHGDVATLEAVVLSVGSVLTVLWWIGGYIALRWELRPLVYLLVATAVLEPAYIVWRLVTEARPASMLVQCELAAGCLALLVRLVLVLCLLSCAAQFGLGVTHLMYPRGPAPRPARTRADQYGSFGGEPVPAAPVDPEDGQH